MSRAGAVMGRVRNVALGIVMAAALLLVILLAGVRLFGIEPLVVTTGSMEPEYPVGSVVYVQPVDVSEISEGDVIAFHIDGGAVATHRVVSVEGSGDTLAFTTKGDANTAIDARPVPASSVVGKVSASVPSIGYVAVFVGSLPGKIVIVGVALALVSLLLIGKR